MNNKAQLSTTVERVTPGIAKVYLSLNGTNRPIKPNIVALYADQMKRGLWKENGEAICFTSDGKLADGQHRLMAVSESGCSIRFVIVRGCEEGSFATYDSGVNRTVADVFAIAGVSNYAKKSSAVNRYLRMCKRNLFVLGRNRNDIDGGSKRLRVARQDVLSEYWSHRDTFDWATKAASRMRDALRLFTEAELGGTMSYLVIEGEFTEACVERFFNALHDERENWNPSIYALRRTLLKDLCKSTGTMTGAHKQALLIKTWNAYVTGSELKRLSYDPDREGKIWFMTRNDAEDAGMNAKRAGDCDCKNTSLFV